MIIPIDKEEKKMYEYECLTNVEIDSRVDMDACPPFLGGCYPEAEGCCGPDCRPN